MTRTLRWLAGAWTVAFVLGLIGLGIRMFTGERLVGYGSYVPWGLWVALYFHGVGIAGGVFVVGTIGYLFRLPVLRDRLPVVLWTSAAAMITGLIAIGLDLGKPFRAPFMFLTPNFTSMMAFNSWMYMVFLATLAACFVLHRRASTAVPPTDRTGWLVPLLCFGIVLGVAFPSQSGVFFGVVEAKPFWSSALLPGLFLTSAIAGGASVLLLILTFLPSAPETPAGRTFGMLRWTIIGAVVVYFVLEFGKMSIALWSPASHAREPVELILAGPFWWVFWIVHVGGGLLALALLWQGRSRAMLGTGAFLIALTFVATRLNVLIPGQSFSELKGLAAAFSHPKLSFHYQATVTEYLVALFIGSVGVGLVYVGLRLLTGFTITHPEKAR
ncbi:MAG: NrfD/PsrC family molybdoenzyme membrane anchor subunit [Gemmatimonadaceae bacterium]